MSSEAVIAELPPEFVRKMRNWASTCAGCSYSFLHYAFTSAYDDLPGGGWGETGVPKLRGEAEDVWRGLAALRARERLAVMLFWSYEGRSLRWLGRRLCISHHTAESRVRRGHEELRRALCLGMASAPRKYLTSAELPNNLRPSV